jgi:hypothetical protein
MAETRSANLVLIVALGVALAGACGAAPAAGSRAIDAGVASDAPAADGEVLDVGVGPWTAPPDAAAPVPLDDVTVYAFSQSGDNESDPQLITLAPDMSIRTFSRWDTYGTRVGDYDFSYVAGAHAAGVKFIGGTTSTVLFEDEFPNAQFPSTA